MRDARRLGAIVAMLVVAVHNEVRAQSVATRELRRRLTPIVLADTTPCAGLGPLGRWPAGSKVFVLGEATHGSAEFAHLKRRSIECLVRTGGVTTVAMEAPYATWVPIDRWVRGGSGSIDSLLGAQGFWSWNTTEVRAMLTALRAWNTGAGRNRMVRVVGVDPKFADRSLTAVLSAFASRAPDLGARFAATRAGLPATRAEFMAWLKLSPEAQDALLAPLGELPRVVDSLLSPQASAVDTLWQSVRWHSRVLAHSVRMQTEDRVNWASDNVGAEITLYIRASGSLATALAAVQTTSPSEAARLSSALAPVAGSYLRFWRDYTTTWTEPERSALREAATALVGAIPSSATDSATNRRNRMAAADVRDMLGMFDRYLGRPVPPRAARDTGMADLVALAATEDGADARLIVWAHDYHASRVPISFFEGTTMTGALERRLPGAVRSVGFAFGSGALLAEFYPLPGEQLPAGVRPGAVREFRIPQGGAAATEAMLAQLSEGAYAIDLRGLRKSWLASPQPYQRYGSGYNDAWLAQSNLSSRASENFDWLVFIPRVTAAALLP